MKQTQNALCCVGLAAETILAQRFLAISSPDTFFLLNFAYFLLQLHHFFFWGGGGDSPKTNNRELPKSNQ